MKKILILLPIIFIVSCSNLQMANHNKIAEQPKFNPNSTMFFSLADMAYQNGDYKNAVPLFEKAERYDSKSAEIKEMLILSLDALSKQDKSQVDKLLELSEKYIKEGYTSDKIYLPRINALISKRKIKEAIPELKKSIKINPTPEKYYKLFLLKGFAENKPDLKILKKAFKLSENKKYDIYILNNLTMMRNPIVLKAAEYVYKKWNDAETFEQYSDNLLKYGFKEKFIKLTTERLDKGKKVSRKTTNSLIEILIEKDDKNLIDKYSDYFLSFNDIRFDKIIYSIEDDLKNYDKATLIMENILKNYSIEDKDKQIMYFFLVNTYLKNSKITEAAETLTKIKNFSKIEYLITKIRLTEENSVIDKIKKIYFNSKTIDNNFKLFFQYCYEEKDDNSGNSDLLEQIDFSKLSKTNAVYIIDIYLSENNTEKAKKYFRKIPSIKESFNLFSAYFFLAKNDFPKAEEFAKLEIKENESVDAYLFYSSVLQKQNKIKESIEILKKANKKYPHNPNLLNGLGYTMVENKIDLDLAEKYLLEATELDSTSANIWDSLMWLYYQKGEYSKALETFPADKLAEVQNSTIAYHLGEIFFKLGRTSDAKYYFHLAIELDTENEAVINSTNKLLEYFKEK